MMQASKQDNIDLGVKSQGTERKPIWVLHSLEGWETGFGIQTGIKQRPRRQAEWLRDPHPEAP